MGLTPPKMQSVPPVGLLISKIFGRTSSLEWLKNRYREDLLRKPMKEFLALRGGVWQLFDNCGCTQEERAEVWQEVYEQRTLLRPACEPGLTLLRASQETSDNQAGELLRGSEK